MSRFQLTLSEYNRVHQTARGVLEGIATAERSCIFFASFGAYILSKHYKIPARAVAGSFALCVSDEPKVAFFGKDDGGRMVSASDGFHMWVQTHTHIIDFMAPIFPETFAEAMPETVFPRKMLQRQIATEATSLDALRVSGDFITLPDPELTESLIDNFLGRPANGDLLMIAEKWFGSRRGKQPRAFAMMNDLGEVQHLSLPMTVATGTW